MSAIRRAVRAAYRWRGAARMAEAIRRASARRGGEAWVDDFDGDLRIGVDLGDHIGSQIYWRGSHSEDALAALDHVLEEDSTFFDVGANIGEFTLFAAKRVPGGSVHAFEPGPDQRLRLVANVEANGFRNVTVRALALGDREGRTTLWVPETAEPDGTINRGKSTTSPSRTEGHAAVPVPETTLDAYVREVGVRRVDCIKMDVEGSEHAVLRGARDLLDRDRPALLLELNAEAAARAGWRPEEVVSGLTSRGYGAWTIGRRGRLRDGVSLGAGGWANVLFVHPSKGAPR